MGRSTWPKRQCCPPVLASLLSDPLPRTAKATTLEGGGIRIDISGIFIHSSESQGKGKPSACPGLLVPEGCFAVVSHRSSPPEALTRASDLSPLPSPALPSQHAEQADSVHAQVTGRGPVPLLCSRSRVFGSSWVHRHDHAERRQMHRGGKGSSQTFTGRESFSLTGCFRRLVCPVGSAALLLLLWLNRFFSPSSIVRRGFRLFFSINRITAYSRSAAENAAFSVNVTLSF